MKILIRLLKKIYLPIIVIYIAFLSYNYNFFRVANNEWFLNHSIFSEQLVIEGLLNGKDEYGRLFLGRYTRDNTLFSEQNNKEVFKLRQKNLTTLDEIEKNISGKFIQYESQYGLQLHLFHYLEILGIKSIKVFQGITALLMSSVVGIFFYLLSRSFSITIASIFSATLVLSPWIVVFARNLYWVEATWFLPMIISMYYGNNNFVSKLSNIKFFVFLVIAYLLKMLCGYEYLTTICIASCVPIILHMSLEKYGIKRCIIKLSLNAISVFVAFFIAIGIHVHLLSKDSSSAHDHINSIILNAKVKTKIHNPSKINELCKYSQNISRELLEKCEETLNTTSSTKPVKVVLRYFIFRDFLPWIGNFYHTQNYNVSEIKDYNVLRTAWKKPSLETIKAVIFETNIETKKNVTIILLNALLFLILILTAFFRTCLKMRLVLMFSFFAPLSWFVLAHGHSSAHYGLNYVLWYLPLIPFSFVALLLNNSGKKII